MVISTTALIMSCDGVEKSGRNITTTCYIKLGAMENSMLRDELMLMAKCTEKLTPKFSAAGFFQVNQHVLATIFSSMTTYLIIIIQFNLTL
ncbi:hypothetical protein NQ314_012173 [Rhamnusium bicolor]|uniref:Uncharacterized protein n=1 Tax=Rhamnusium bicolor TaxID=1586634 RepID=A0AAV8XFE0_9CUCU|nr:hypothetical protein NQ314_012173 [Rhamnusium bicolor]